MSLTLSAFWINNSSTLPKLKQMLQQPQNEYVKNSVSFLQNFLSSENFSTLYVSFNGGKDATVVLFLVYFALLLSPHPNRIIKCIYFQEPNPFQEVDEFMDSIKNLLPIQLFTLPSKKYASELSLFCSEHETNFIVMGSRRTDPYCQNLCEIARSDTCKGYPDFKRINPILQWDCSDVWSFLLSFEIPYCSLYEEGYTSLGNKDNTIKNDHLYDKQSNQYTPASQSTTQVERKSRLHFKLNPESSLLEPS